jgi:hypothetical protein
MKVKQFPIYHYYLASILLEVKLAEEPLAHLLDTVGEYTVTGRCECGDETCSTMYMKSDSLVGKDGTYCFGFNIGFIIFSFYKDGFFMLESLADNVSKYNYPFSQEIRCVLAGRTVFYDDAYAKIAVDYFMEGLKRVDVERIDV